MIHGADAADPSCPHCGFPARTGAAFCKRCGKALTEVPSPSVAPPSRPSAPPSSIRVIARRAEVRSIAWLYGAFLATSLAVGIASRFTDQIAKMETIFTILDGAVVLGFAATRWRDVAPLLGRVFASARSAATTAVAFVVFFTLLDLYFKGLTHLGAPLLRMTEPYVREGWSESEMLVVLSLCPAFFEELAFRGIVQAGLGRVLAKRDALVVQAAMFSVLHLSPIIFVSHFFMGLVLGHLRDENRSLYPGMALHAAWNAFVVHDELHGAFSWALR